MITDPNGLVHQAGCADICGWHDPETYTCGCLSPRPNRAGTCTECGARVVDEAAR